MSVLIVSLLPSLIALTCGSWSGPVIGAPALGAAVLWLVMAYTPSDSRILGHTFRAPVWSGAARFVAFVLFLASCAYGTWVGVAG